MNHNDLCYDLAYQKDTVFVNVHLGSPWGAAGFNHRQRIHRIMGEPAKEKMIIPLADVVNIRPSFTRFCIDIFEVKASRADFLNDIRSGKWERYLPHCHRFYFAVREGVAIKNDMPEGVGLIIKNEKCWHATKGSTARDVEIPYETMLALLFYRKKHRSRLGPKYGGVQ